MEARKITIRISRNQLTYTIMSQAETLGELIGDMQNNGIAVPAGAIFREGLSKTELLQKGSLLPRDIQYKGNTTNELVFIVSESVKKIKSGNMTRKEILNRVKELDLTEFINRKYKKNFTCVKSCDLEKEIKKAEKKASKNSYVVSEVKTAVPSTEEAVNAVAATTTVDNTCQPDPTKEVSSAICSVEDVLNGLHAVKVLIEEIERSINEMTAGAELIDQEDQEEQEKALESPYSDAELNDILGRF